MDATGRTTLCVATHTVEGGGDDKPLTLGACLPRLQHGTGSLHSEYPNTAIIRITGG